MLTFAQLEKIMSDAKAAGLPAEAPVLLPEGGALERAEIDLGSKVEGGDADPQVQVTRAPALKLFHAV